MAKHPIQITITDGNPEELAKIIRRTSYEYQRKLYKELSIGYEEDSQADKKRKYFQLSNLLFVSSKTLNLVANIFDKIWKICEPHMKN